MNNAHLDLISRVERLHRQFLEVVKLELDGMGIRDINNVQAMMLFNIGDEEMTVGELTLRGCYLGSNVTYNVKAMVEQGYLSQQRSVHDRRSVHVRLTEKGKQLRDGLMAVHSRHVNMLPHAAVTAADLQTVGITLRRLDGFWGHRRLGAMLGSGGLTRYRLGGEPQAALQQATDMADTGAPRYSGGSVLEC
jgi:DNA-binding MarR family transcriptional regulator